MLTGLALELVRWGGGGVGQVRMIERAKMQEPQEGCEKGVADRTQDPEIVSV